MVVWKEKPTLIRLDDQHKNAIPDMLWRFLSCRLESSEDLNEILNPTLSGLKDPYLILNMDKAVDRLVQAYKANEHICIYADFDLDGASGLAILYDSFTKMGFKNLSYYQPKRLSEGYGFHPHAVEDLHHQGISLIVTVDVGITSIAAGEKAAELGVDVILTDHHLPGSQLPKAYCVVNPNQKDCTSGLGYLCGAGVGFYLVRALMRKLIEENCLEKNQLDLKEQLDFFCIGTLTDMVPLIGDNRILVKHGMKVLENTKRPGLKYLLSELDLVGRELSSQDVAIKFAPKLNALSRMESDVLPIQIYLEKDEIAAKKIVSKILKNNQTRQNLQQAGIQISDSALKSWTEADFIYLSSTEFHRGIIGLIATKLANEKNIPVFIGSINDEGVIVGSSRLPPGYEGSLVDALAFSTKSLNRHGGHAAAAGFELNQDNEKFFIDKLKEFFTLQKKEHRPIVMEFDSSAQISDLNQNTFKWYHFFGPYGVGFVTPLFKFSGLELFSLKEIKGGHLKMVFKESNSSKKSDVLFFSPPKAKASQLQIGKKYDLLGEIQMNYFNNSQSIQILLKDFKIYEN